MKTDQVKMTSFATMDEKPAQEDCIFVFCWAFLYVIVAGSWSDLHHRVCGSVRLFCAQMSGF